MRSLPEGADDSGHSCTIGSEIYLDVSYLHYLYDARRSIGSCLRACRVWSAPYDGKDPPPDKYHAGVLKEPVLKGRPPQGTPRKLPQPLAQARPAKNREPASGNPLELEWDDSYDACPVQAADAGEEPAPSAEPPKHIQEMRKTAIMLVKGSYIEENDFQDDVMVYDLVAKKDSRDSERGEPRSNKSAPQGAPPGSDEAFPDTGRPAPPRNTIGLDSKAGGQTGCDSNLQNGAAPELRDDLLAQYEDLLRALDTGPGGKAVRDEGGSRKPATPAEEGEEQEEEMDFSFIPETPEPEKVHSPFGKFFGGTAGRGQSVPFTGQSRVPAFPPRPTEPRAKRHLCARRSVRQRAAVPHGEHAEQLAPRQPAADGDPGPAGGVPAAPPALLPAQHQLGIPAVRPLPLPGRSRLPGPRPLPRGA